MRKNLFLLFCLLVFGWLFNGANISAQLFVYEENVATFPELKGGKDALTQFIQSHLNYPLDAIANRIEGRVIVGFTITETGKMEDIQIQHSLYPACDSAVIQLIESMPDWEPAKQIDNIPMRCHNSLPISFDLSAYRKINGKNCDCLDAIKQTTDTIYNVHSVDTPPNFPGGEVELLNYLARNTVYPIDEAKNGHSGIASILVIVTPTGKVTCTEAIQSLGKNLDNAAIKSIKAMPTWTPGMKNGKPVYTYYTVPVTFRLIR
jgi:TonB family protein